MGKYISPWIHTGLCIIICHIGTGQHLSIRRIDRSTDHIGLLGISLGIVRIALHIIYQFYIKIDQIAHKGKKHGRKQIGHFDICLISYFLWHMFFSGLFLLLFPLWLFFIEVLFKILFHIL